MNHDGLSALKAFAPQGYFHDSPTISLADTSLLTPSTPGSVRSCSVGPSQPEKKPVKKRKSWGQELPIPKTNLPPRKRAKTEDEKEQRRIERVLRNRAAAQSSRERKRQEVERLEGEKQNIEYHNHCLKQRLLAVEHEKFLLMQEVVKLRTMLGHPNPNAAVAMPPQPKNMPALLKPVPRETPEAAFNIATPQSLRSPAPSRASLPPSIAPSSVASRSPSPAPSSDFAYGDVSALDLTQHPAVSVQRRETHHSDDSSHRPASRRSSVSVALTHASTCDSSPASDGPFGRLLASPGAAEPHISFFEDGLAAPGDLDVGAAGDASAFAFDSLVDVDASLGVKPHPGSEPSHFDLLASHLAESTATDVPPQPAASSVV